MGFVVKRCPHCECRYESRSSHDYSDHFGRPIRLCPKCKKSFIDSEYREPALTTFEKFLPSKFVSLFSKGRIANFLLSAFFIVASIMLWYRDGWSYLYIITFLLGFGIGIPFFKGLLICIRGFSKKEYSYYANAYIESLYRMCDFNYIALLQKYGYKIRVDLTKDDRLLYINNEIKRIEHLMDVYS